MTANIPLMSFFLFVDLTSPRVEKVYPRHFSLPEDQKVKAQRLNVTLVFVMATLSQDRRHLRSATFGGTPSRINHEVNLSVLRRKSWL